MRFTHSLVTSLLFTTGALSVWVKRQLGDRTNVVTNSKISDPVAECSPYWFPPWDNYSKNFPPTWTTAKLVSGDAAGLAKYNEIKDKIPNISLKIAGQAYDTGNDPDCWWSATNCVKPKLSGIPADVTKVPEPLSIGYGFDDGPNCAHNAFYDFLQKNNQKATMFFIGSNVVNWPLEAQRALYDGHEMCAHSWSHSSMTQLTNEQAFAEIYYTVQVIKAITGVTPTCFRPPYGDTDDRIRFIVNALGLSTVLWQYDSNDWKGGDQVDQNYQTFVNRATAGEFNSIGSVFLQHESSEFTMNAAMKWHPAMKSSFAYMVPVAVALNKTRPYLETNVEFPTFNEYISGTVQKPLPASALSYLGVTAMSTSTSSTAASSSTSRASSTAASSTAASSTAASSTAAPSTAASSTAASSSAASSSSARISSTVSSSATSVSASRSSSVSKASSTSASSGASSSTASSSTASASSTAPANPSTPPTLSANPTQAEWGVAFAWMKSYMDSLMSKWKW